MIDKLKYVMAVYQERSFTRAAEKLFVTQAAISKIIRQVESDIGVPIFDRGTIPLTLTKEGEIYIRYARKILHLDAELQSHFEDVKQLKTGTLSLGGSSFFCSFLYPDLLGKFSRLYPGVLISVQEGNVAMLRAELEDESVDLIVETALKGNETALNTWELCAEHIILAVPMGFKINQTLKDYQLEYSRLQDNNYMKSMAAVPLEKFSCLPFVLLTEGNDLLPRAIAICKEAGFVPKIALQVDQILTATNLCAAGLGVTFTRPAVVQSGHFSERICFYRLEGPLATRKIYFASKKSRHLSPAMSAFLEISVPNYHS